MEIKHCMKPQVVSIPETATIAEAATIVLEKRIGTLPVVDQDGVLVGVLRLRDLVKLVMPDFIQLVEDFKFVHDFGAVETRLPSNATLSQSVLDIILDPISVEETCGLLRAAAIMYRQNLADILVVSADGKLVGIASHVDIGVALLSTWNISHGGMT